MRSRRTNDAGRRGALRRRRGDARRRHGLALGPRGPARAVDVLVVDEAGQFSLANAVAVAPAARSLVLLGDPQQLTQPTQAVHPYGVRHLGARAPARRARHRPARPRRLPRPDVPHAPRPSPRSSPSCAYEGRLDVRARPRTARVSAHRAAVRATGCAGCRCTHDGGTVGSPQEAGWSRRSSTTCAAATWTDAEGVERPLGLDDVLVVAPYNAHVAACARRCPRARGSARSTSSRGSRRRSSSTRWPARAPPTRRAGSLPLRPAPAQRARSHGPRR